MSEQKEKFLYKGRRIKQSDKVKAIDSVSGCVDFYQVERVWGSHAIMRKIDETEAGPNPILITVTREAR